MIERGPMADLELHACALEVGDIVETAHGSVRVVSEPMTVHRGWSPFDRFELLIGAHVQGPDDATPRFHVWRLNERLRVRRDVDTERDA
jgi:hypothetical protein